MGIITPIQAKNIPKKNPNKPNILCLYSLARTSEILYPVQCKTRRYVLGSPGALFSLFAEFIRYCMKGTVASKVRELSTCGVGLYVAHGKLGDGMG